MSTTDRPFEQQMRSTAIAAYAAMGMERPVEIGYARRGDPSCAVSRGIEEGLDDGQAWYARLVFDGGRGQSPDDAALLATARRHFADAGWQLQDYAGPRDLRGFTAIKDGRGVTFEVPQTAMVLTSGPCALERTGLRGIFRPVP